ncbi:hypothetical protein [Anaerotignum sp.]|uniref:hypothetical protein n=1 Tax=Anaerotignum sp. TaxID=2039241 RepID=UPI002715469B|nr:hypothetical protein [Anaerotignum sp.]
MKKNSGKTSLIFVLTCLAIGVFFDVNNVQNPFGYLNTLPPPAMTADLVGSYNHEDDSKISLTFAFDGKDEFHYVDGINNIEDIGTFEKVKEGVYSLEGSLIERQEITVMEDFSFDIKINGVNMLFKKESQEAIWITVPKQ